VLNLILCSSLAKDKCLKLTIDLTLCRLRIISRKTLSGICSKVSLQLTKSNLLSEQSKIVISPTLRSDLASVEDRFIVSLETPIPSTGIPMFTKPQTRFPTPQPVSKTLSDVEGGDLLLLHVDDWQDLDKFYNPPLAKHKLQWS